MAGVSKLCQEPAALKTINPFRNVSFPLPDREMGIFFFLCSAFLALILWVSGHHVVKSEFFLRKILHNIVSKLNQRKRL